MRLRRHFGFNFLVVARPLVPKAEYMACAVLQVLMYFVLADGCCACMKQAPSSVPRRPAPCRSSLHETVSAADYSRSQSVSTISSSRTVPPMDVSQVKPADQPHNPYAPPSLVAPNLGAASLNGPDWLGLAAHAATIAATSFHAAAAEDGVKKAAAQNAQKYKNGLVRNH